MVLHSFIIAWRSILRPPVFRLAVYTALLSLAAMITLVILVYMLLSSLTLIDWAWLDTTIDVLGGLGAMALAWLLYPAMLPLIASLFADRIATQVEHMNQLPIPSEGTGSSLLQDIPADIRFVFIVLGLNLLLLPFYLIPFVNLALYYLVNGYLVGREFFVMVASRHQPRQDAEQLRKQRQTAVWMAGALLVFCSNIPFINVLVPFLAVAMMVVLYHKKK